MTGKASMGRLVSLRTQSTENSDRFVEAKVGFDTMRRALRS